jgi:hypothetical protein
MLNKIHSEENSKLSNIDQISRIKNTINFGLCSRWYTIPESKEEMDYTSYYNNYKNDNVLDQCDQSVLYSRYEPRKRQLVTYP